MHVELRVTKHESGHRELLVEVTMIKKVKASYFGPIDPWTFWAIIITPMFVFGCMKFVDPKYVSMLWVLSGIWFVPTGLFVLAMFAHFEDWFYPKLEPWLQRVATWRNSRRK